MAVQEVESLRASLAEAKASAEYPNILVIASPKPRPAPSTPQHISYSSAEAKASAEYSDILVIASPKPRPAPSTPQHISYSIAEAKASAEYPNILVISCAVYRWSALVVAVIWSTSICILTPNILITAEICSVGIK